MKQKKNDNRNSRTPTTQHKGKRKSSVVTENCLERHAQFKWLHSKKLTEETRYKIRENSIS